MSERVTSRPLRTKIVTAALLIGLVGGTIGIDTVGSHLSSEVGRSDRSTSIPAPQGPIASVRASFGTS
jgi:hypothetical protein